MSKTAVVLHIFYEDIASEILSSLSSLDAEFDLFVTTPIDLSEALSESLRDCGHAVQVIECQNSGQDIAPFLSTVPLLVENRYEAVCKLHTKRGVSEIGEHWRRVANNAVIGDSSRFSEIQSLFQSDKKLAILGSKELYMSADAHMYGNHDRIVEILRSAYPGAGMPPDWGFFAGSVFWLRPELFGALSRTATRMQFGDAKIERDGQVAHAFERLFGLVPVLNKMNVGLVGSETSSGIEISAAPGKPSREATSQTLRRLATAEEPLLDLASIFRDDNPLLHYIRHGEKRGDKPNPIFDPAWYLRKNPDVAAGQKGPLRHFMRFGAPELRDPSPDFDSRYYLSQNPDVQRAGMPPAMHYLSHGRFEGRQPAPHFTTELRRGEAENEAPAEGTRPYGIGAEGSRFGSGDPDSAGVRQIPGRARLRGVASDGVERRPVLVVGHWSEPGPLFGAERSLLDVIRALHGLGYPVHCAFPHENPEYFDAVLDHACSLSVFKYHWWQGWKPLDERAVVAFMRIMREHEIGLVHVNTIMLREPLEAARRLGITSAVHIREIISHDPDLIADIGLEPREVIQQVKQRTDFLIGNSGAALSGFDCVDEEFRVYNGVDVGLLDIANPVAADEVRVGLISSNVPKKGLADFVNLAQLAQEELPRLRFVLIGPVNKHIRNLAKLAGLRQLPSNIEIAGYADDSRAALEQVNIVMNVSHFAESFGRTVAEGMAARRPAIVYDYGALSELVRHGVDGYVIPYRQFEQALGPLRELCEQPSKIEEMGRQARTRAVEQFSLESMAVRLEVAYRRMAAHSEARAKPAEPLRIGYFMWHFPVPSETFVLNELRGLTEQGIDVKVFCRHSPHPEFVPDFAIEWQSVETPEELADALRAAGRNLVHAHFTYPTVTNFAWPACERAGLDFTFTAHAQDIFRVESDKRNRIGEIARSPFCRKIFVLGHFHHAYLVERGVPPEKLMINSQMSDVPLLQKRSGAAGIGVRFDRRRICAIQRLVEKKGLAFLVEAAPRLKWLGVSVDIYGYGPLEASIAKRIEQLGVDNVRLLGPVTSRDQLLKVFSEHDLLITPSVRAADGDMDGIPTVLMEAMGTGLPVLSSSIASVPDLIKDGVDGVLFNSGDPEAIVAAIERFYRMPSGRIRAMTENAKHTVQLRYDPGRVLANLMRQWREEAVDLVIVSWNNLPELRRVIERLFKYTSLPFKLIICDNDSGADVVAYLEALAEHHKNVTLVRKGYNSFVGPGTNTAVDAGSSRYAIYVCGREGFAVNHGWEGAMVEYMDDHPDVGLAGRLGYSPSYLTGKAYIENHPLFSQFRNQHFAAEHPDRVFRHVQGGLFVIRRAMYAAIGGFSEAVPHAHTDTEYSYYVESSGWQLGDVPGILSLYSKTRPGLLSRLDENVVAVHPSNLAMENLLDRIAAAATALCNVCSWHGEAFEGEGGGETCPKCGSGPSQRTVYRYLADSLLTHRKLAGLYVNPHKSLEAIWEQQFEGPIMSLREFDRAAADKNTELSDARFDVICVADEVNDAARMQHLHRLLKPDGVLLIREAVGETGAPLVGQTETLAASGLHIEQRLRYASAVVRFDWRALLVCRRVVVS